MTPEKCSYCDGCGQVCDVCGTAYLHCVCESESYSSCTECRGTGVAGFHGDAITTSSGEEIPVTRTRVDPTLKEPFKLTAGVQVDTPKDATNFCPKCGKFPLPKADYGRLCGDCRVGTDTLFPIDVFITTYRSKHIDVLSQRDLDAPLLSNADEVTPGARLIRKPFGESPQDAEELAKRYPVWREMKKHIGRLLGVDPDEITAKQWKSFKLAYCGAAGINEKKFLEVNTKKFIESVQNQIGLMPGDKGFNAIRDHGLMLTAPMVAQAHGLTGLPAPTPEPPKQDGEEI